MTTTDTTAAAGRPWNPSNRDRLIYHWVKFDGHKQTWVADQLGLNQSTVSRIVDRYERWIARGGPTQHGAPSREERIRAQRWLTYERNEWILASCMRLAGEMERSLDTSKSTIRHHAVDPSREIEIRTEHKTLERSGTACRFLRLAHRVNMDQEKLLAKLDLPALDPLTLDVSEQSQATADAREGFQPETPFECGPADSETLARSASEGKPPATPTEYPAATAAPQPRTPNPEPPSLSPTHTPTTPASPLNPASTITSVEIAPAKKPIARAYALPQNPPEPTDGPSYCPAATAQESHSPPPPIHLCMPLIHPGSLP